MNEPSFSDQVDPILDDFREKYLSSAARSRSEILDLWESACSEIQDALDSAATEA